MGIKGEEGQSAVEFALVLPILIVLLCGIIDFGWLYSCDIAATNAAREAARYTAVHYYDSSADDDLSKAKSIVLEDAPQLPAGSTQIELLSLDTDSDGIQESVQIKVTTPIQLLTGLTSMILGKSAITISATSIMKFE
ncbi:TadE/TadG family type IV pilus assembly protein [Oscillospiraceae bacterium WX1]